MKKNIYFVILIALITSSSAIVSSTEVRRMKKQSAPDIDGKIKILLYYDMEGVTGQNDIKSIDFDTKEYEEARIWLTDDVNAVIKGLFKGGADFVDVVDAHGSGNPKPDIFVERMDSRAKMINRETKFDPYLDIVEKNKYDAIVAVAMHSRTGGGGFAEHTINVGLEWILNDMPVTESEMLAYAWGKVNVPLIFVSGDDKLQEQISWMNWVKYVRVKNAKGLRDADLFPFDTVRTKLLKKAAEAVKDLEKSYSIQLKSPIKAQLRAFSPANLGKLEGMPGIDYKDNTVTFYAKSYEEAYDGIRVFSTVAQDGYYEILFGIVSKQKNFTEIWKKTKELGFAMWHNPNIKKESTTITEKKQNKQERLEKNFGSK